MHILSCRKHGPRLLGGTLDGEGGRRQPIMLSHAAIAQVGDTRLEATALYKASYPLWSSIAAKVSA